MSHSDHELDAPQSLSSERLVEIVRDCLRPWGGRYVTLPGAPRWFRNGGVALSELERRLAAGPQVEAGE